MRDEITERETLTPSCKDGFNAEASTLRFDPEAYARHLAAYDLTEAQQLQLMRAVWDLMVLFVDAGFGVDGPTLAQPIEARTVSPRNSKQAGERTPEPKRPEKVTP